MSIIRYTDDQDNISNKDQKMYVSGVRILIYMVQSLRPDNKKSVQELSKVLNGEYPERSMNQSLNLTFTTVLCRVRFITLPIGEILIWAEVIDVNSIYQQGYY